MQQLNLKGDTKEAEAIDWLRSSIGDKHVLVCFSGGKDSIVTEALCRMAGLSFSLNSTLTGIDPPQVTQFIRRQYPTCTFVRPHLSFWYLLTTHNPPGGTGGRGIKWCCTKIKEKPSASIPIKHRIMGIRAEESHTRAKYNRTNQVGNEIHYHPIFYWRTWKVFEFIVRHNLSLPTVADGSCIYDHLDRVGCVICPNHTGTHDIYRRLWPNHFKCFERYVRIWWDKRVSQGREMYHGSPEEFLADWYQGKFYYYKAA